MNPRYITAVVQSIEELARTMLDVSVQVGSPALMRDIRSRYDVSAIIGISGGGVGFVAMGFPTQTASNLVSRFVGAPVSPEDPDFGDGIGELANMVTGGAKARFQRDDLSISCPSVVIGAGHQICQRRDMPVIELPINSDCGPFVLAMALRDREAPAILAAG